VKITDSWRRHGRDRADAGLLRRVAAGLRDGPDRLQVAGLGTPADGVALAALLELLAAELPHLDPVVRLQVVGSCRDALGEVAPPSERVGGRGRPRPSRSAAEPGRR
jgi:hypothetical protein